MPLSGGQKTVGVGKISPFGYPFAEVPSDDVGSLMAVSLKKLSPQIQKKLEPQFSLGLFFCKAKEVFLLV